MGMPLARRVSASFPRQPSPLSLVWPSLLRSSRTRYTVSSAAVPSTKPAYQALQFIEEPFALGLHRGFGYPRINIGDRFGRDAEYEVVHKLGWGFHATTWLVKNHQKNRHFALKVLTVYATHLQRGEIKTPGHSHLHEVEIMRRLSLPTSSRGSMHCLHLVEAFCSRRDTGNHDCLIAEPATFTLENLQNVVTTNGGFPSLIVKRFVRQLCLALDYLHTECRVVHTDIKPSNILLTFEQGLMEELIGLHLKHRPVRRHPMQTVLGVSEETIVSDALPTANFKDVSPLDWNIKLVDFGSAQWLDRRSTDNIQPVQLRAPEVVLGRAWDAKVDIWSLGCLMFEFLVGHPLFRAQQAAGWSEEEDLLAAQLETHQLTRFPLHFYEGSKHAAKYLNADGSLRSIGEGNLYPKTLARVLANYNKVPINKDDPSSERAAALAFMERCLALDPGERASAAELLGHPWLQGTPSAQERKRALKRTKS